MKLSSLVPPQGKSKYELAIVAAREARRLNEWIRRSGETLHGKVTAVALERVIHDEAPYFYEELSQVAQAYEPLAEPTLE